MDAWLVTLILGQLAFVGLILWIVVYSRIQKGKRESEERLRVLERFSSAEELHGFLKTDSGRELLHVFAPAPASRTNPHFVILGAVALGVLTLFGGLAFFALMLFFGRQSEFSDVSPMVAVLLLTCGVGVLVAAGVSLYLARSWNLVEKPGHGD